MPELATEVLIHDTCKDSMGIIYVVYVNVDQTVHILKVSPSGVKLKFSDNTEVKQIGAIAAVAVGIEIKNSILCLKYLDNDLSLQQLFSSNTGESWSSTF